MDLDRAEAVAKVAQVVVNSAKVEVDFQKHVGGIGSGFIDDFSEKPKQIEGYTNGEAH
jgi:hypothetical protein